MAEFLTALITALMVAAFVFLPYFANWLVFEKIMDDGLAENIFAKWGLGWLALIVIACVVILIILIATLFLQLATAINTNIKEFLRVKEML